MFNKTEKDFIIPSMIYYYYRPSESITIVVKLESFLFFSVIKRTGPLKNTFSNASFFFS